MQGKGIDGCQLKCIAVVTMLIDHVYKALGYDILIEWLPGVLHISRSQAFLVMTFLFGIGAATVFIFAWMTAEGCRHTHDIRKYILRLLLFGIISEIPFQYMICIIAGTPLKLHLGFTNIMFTLMLGVLACLLYQKMKDSGFSGLAFGALLLCMAAAHWLNTDYEMYGVLAVFMCYAVRDQKKRLWALGGLIVFYYGFARFFLETAGGRISWDPILFYAVLLCYALLSLLLLARYNGKRGKTGKAGKYFFYLFYPLHITLIVMVYIWMH